MLRLSGLDNFYYLPMLHDMRYKGASPLRDHSVNHH